MKFHKFSILLAIICIVMLVFGSSPKNQCRQWVSLIYVDNTIPSASDSNAGTNPALPFLTLEKGAHVARAGDTVQCIRWNLCRDNFFRFLWSGLDGSPIIFTANPGVTVTGNGVIDLRSAFSILGRSYIVIEGFTIADTIYKGIYVSTSDHISIL